MVEAPFGSRSSALLKPTTSALCSGCELSTLIAADLAIVDGDSLIGRPTPL